MNTAWLLQEARKAHEDPTLHAVYEPAFKAWTVRGRKYDTTLFPTERTALACAIVDTHRPFCDCVVCDWYYNKYIDGDET